MTSAINEVATYFVKGSIQVLMFSNINFLHTASFFPERLHDLNQAQLFLV